MRNLETEESQNGGIPRLRNLETVDDETVDDETVDDETVDDETGRGLPAPPFSS